MVTGQHIATCICCGHQWTVGDSIPMVCPDCEKKGHTGGFQCPQCEKERGGPLGLSDGERAARERKAPPPPGEPLRLKLSDFVTVMVDGPYARLQGYGPDGKETTHFDITRVELVALLQLLTMMVTPEQLAKETDWLAECAKSRGDNPPE